MSSDRLPKIVFAGELTEGKRPVSRPKLRCKDVMKTSGVTRPSAAGGKTKKCRPPQKKSVVMELVSLVILLRTPVLANVN